MSGCIWHGGYCPVGIWPGGICPGGICPRTLIYNSEQCAQFHHRKNTSHGPSGALLKPYSCWPTIWSTFRCSNSIRQHLMSMTSPGPCSLEGQQGPPLSVKESALAFL